MSNFTLKRKFPITANPQGTSTDSLTKIGIGNDIYDIGSGNANYVEITQARYNALSSAEKNNGTFYFITDAEGGGGSGGIDGSTVTPTDDVSIWLACAGLHQSYMTLNEVLADSGVLSALMANTNAVDYLVRSTTWATDICANETAMSCIGANDYCADILSANNTWATSIGNSVYWEEVWSALVPKMTSNTTPSGYEATASVTSDRAYFPWRGVATTPAWFASYAPAYVTIKLPSSKVVKKLFICTTAGNFRTFKLSGSNDNSTYTDLGSFGLEGSGLQEKYCTINNNTAYQYYRITCLTVDTGINPNLQNAQLYGRGKSPVVDTKADISSIGTEEAGNTSSRDYAVGEHFYKNGKFCTAIASIASGATFTLGTNYVEGTLSDTILNKNYIKQFVTNQTDVMYSTYTTYWNLIKGSVSGTLILSSDGEHEISIKKSGLYIFCLGNSGNLTFSKSVGAQQLIIDDIIVQSLTIPGGTIASYGIQTVFTPMYLEQGQNVKIKTFTLSSGQTYLYGKYSTL